MLKKISAALLCALFTTSSYAGSTNQLLLKFQSTPEAGRKKAMTFDDTNRFSTLAGEPVRMKRAMSGGAYVLELSRTVSTEEAEAIAERIAQAADVEYVEPDEKRFIRFVPNDEQYPFQWALDDSANGGAGDIRAQAAWDVSRGASSVVVAVLDTGHLPHRDIDESRILAGYDFIGNANISNDGDGRDADPTDPGDYDAADCAAGNNLACSSSWHGLVVEGLISASTDNVTDVAGIDHRATILPVRVLGVGGGYISDIIDAMRWSVGMAISGVPSNPRPAKVINLSFGGVGPCSTAEQNAIDDVVARGAVIVVAAGNESSNVSDSAPANCNGVIAVGATDRAGDFASSYSNYGDLIDVSAPGGEVGVQSNQLLVLFNVGQITAGADTVAVGLGTSLSSAQVSGVASLMFAVNSSLTPGQVESLLKSSARAFPSGSTCNTSICGNGIVNAAGTVNSALDVPPPSSSGGGGGGNFGWPSLLALLFTSVSRLLRRSKSSRV